MRRKHDAEQRRRELCDAAIGLLAADGAKGLSHLKVDRACGAPNGTTSFYYRSRSALLCGVANRIAEQDREALVAALQDSAPEPTASLLAKAVVVTFTEPHLTRTKARVELMLHADRDPALGEIMQRQSEVLTTAFRQIITQLVPANTETDTDDAIVDGLTTVAMTFVQGLLSRLAQGEHVISTPEQFDALLSAIVTRVLASGLRGRLTDHEPLGS